MQPVAAYGFRPGSAATIPTSEVELVISVRNLPDLDVFSKSDPMVVVYTQPFGSKQWQEYARTETIMNQRNPNFTKKITMPYRFEENQYLKFEVYDVDSSRPNLEDHDFIGWVETTLGFIVSNHVIQEKIKYHNANLSRGTLIVTAEELSANKEELEIQLAARKLKKLSLFSKPDPFIVISKSNETGMFVPVHKTEVAKSTLNPSWKSFRIPMRTLNNGDYSRELKVECFSRNSWAGSQKLIGEAHFSVQQLLDGPLPMSFPCVNQEKLKKKSYSNSGSIEVVACKIHPVCTFLDYLAGGTEINCTIAIDFTASNRDPSDPLSLHHYHKGPTQYELALSAVGEIVEEYDTDKQFPVLGFGAKLKPNDPAVHEFHVNFDPSDPYCNRVSGVIEAYRQCLTRVQLYGPTNFAPIIRHVTRFAQQYQDGTHYFILLILTDGAITDMYTTKEAIVSASTLPLSIVIVGIGNADFSLMDELDSDNCALTAPSGKVAARDIVQFVPFNKFLVPGLDPSIARLHLAREVLREVPEQFISYMKSRNIIPKPPQSTPDSLPADPTLL